MPVIGQGPYQGVLLITGSGAEDGIHQQSLFVSMKLPEGEVFNEEGNNSDCSARTFILKIKNKLTTEQQLVNVVASQFGFKVSSIEDICKIINTGTISGEQIVFVLNILLRERQITTDHAVALLNCLVQAGLISADTDSIRRL